MSRACSTHGSETGNLNGRDFLGDLDTVGKVILKEILKELN
jgi:hypothetical protein